MKKLTLLLAGLMIVGVSFAGGGDKGCCKGKKDNCSKEKKEKCEKGGGCCQKKSSTEKKS